MNQSMRYVRFDAFRRMLGPFSKETRKARMEQLNAVMQLRTGTRVLDLGGQPQIWNFIETPLDIVILNLPGVAAPPPLQSVHQFQYVEGDGCNVEKYADKSFEFVFSNSVIEHVGDKDRQRAFASEIRRLADKYWVQTPSIWFPVEAHTGMPFWFVLPEFVRGRFIKSWEKSLPDWTEMVKGTTVIKKGEMHDYFPGASVITERKFGIPKSYIFYKA